MATETIAAGQKAKPVGVMFGLIELSTFYGAVAKVTAVGNLRISRVTAEGIDDHRLIYDLENEPVPHPGDQWPSLPDTTTVTSTAGERLIRAIRGRLDGQDCSTFGGSQETNVKDEPIVCRSHSR